MYLLIVSGMSGAGKTTALNSLEELGFFCVDNLPSPMLLEFIELCKNARPQITRAAVTIDSRESLLSRNSTEILRCIDQADSDYEVLFLDARDEVLRKRYNESRRRHPLGDAGEAESGVRHERIFLQSMRNRATYILDTSDIAPRKLASVVQKIIPEIYDKRMTLLISSFGYKRGVPVDADIVVDMRFVENPFYFEDMKLLSGLDEKVSQFVLKSQGATELIATLEESLIKLIPLYEAQQKHYLRVCFGCTGGRHRSVAAAEELARRMRNSGQAIRIYHRDLFLEEMDILSRITRDRRS